MHGVMAAGRCPGLRPCHWLSRRTGGSAAFVRCPHTPCCHLRVGGRSQETLRPRLHKQPTHLPHNHVTEALSTHSQPSCYRSPIGRGLLEVWVWGWTEGLVGKSTGCSDRTQVQFPAPTRHLTTTSYSSSSPPPKDKTGVNRSLTLRHFRAGWPSP